MIRSMNDITRTPGRGLAGPGRPRGTKDTLPVLGIRQQRKVFRDVQRRALEGSAEDQRLLLAHELCTQMRESHGFNPMGVGLTGITKGLLSL